MKKILAVCVCAVAATAFAAVEDMVLTFSSTGPDRYADGTVVMDGERYALVWQPAGATGKVSILATGAVADSSQGEIVLMAPVAKGGRCPTVAFQIDSSFAEARAGGTWSLYLLDTRTFSESGEVSLAGAEGLRSGVVNAADAVAGASVLAVGKEAAVLDETSSQSAAATAAAVAATASEVPADAPTPKISGIRVEGGYVYVTVAGTAPYLQYNLDAGANPASLDRPRAARNPVSGRSGGEIVLVSPVDGPSAFFRVGRN